MTDAGRRDILGRGEKGKTPAQKDVRTSGKGNENHVIGSMDKPGGVDTDTEGLKR